MTTVAEDQVDLNSKGEPVITGTNTTVKEIMEKLVAGVDWLEIIKVCHLRDDLVVDVAVEYAKTCPPDSALFTLLGQYRQQQMQKVQQILHDFKQHCQQLYGKRLVQLVLFGSMARGDFKPSSDIDVLVVLKAPWDWQVDSSQVTDFLDDTAIKTGELLSCVFMDQERFQNGGGSLLRNVRAEGIAV